MPASRFFLPVISHGHTGKKIVAMTFDDGPDPAITGKLLELLSLFSVRATFFIPGRRASLYPELVRDILARGHDIGNHSYNHNPFLMLRHASDMDYDITSGQRILETFGVVPLAFRPPVGVTDPSFGGYCSAWAWFASPLVVQPETSATVVSKVWPAES